MEEKIQLPLTLIHAPGDPDSKLLTTDSIMIVKGPVGSGKSRVVCNLVKGLITGVDDIGLVYPSIDKDQTILYVNTELSRAYLHARYHNLARVCNMHESEFEKRLSIVDFLPISLKDRRAALLQCVTTDKPSIVIIDQIGDFIQDINNTSDSTSLVEFLTSLVSKFNLGMIQVIHQNEGSGQMSKARGSAGSELEQKIFSGLSISKPNAGIHRIITTKIRDGAGIQGLDVVYNKETDFFKKSDVPLKKVVKQSKLDPNKYASLLPCSVGALALAISNTDKWSDKTARTRIDEMVDSGVWIKYQSSEPGSGNITIVSLAIPGQYGPIN